MWPDRCKNSIPGVSVDRENDITPVLDHTFCVEHNAFGRILQHELKPNGRNLSVTEENKKEYVRYIGRKGPSFLGP